MVDYGADHELIEQQGKIAVPGGNVWYGIAGSLGQRRTPLLVLHGGPGMNHGYLLPLTDLADDRPVIFYDQLDAGASDRVNDPANWTIARFLQEIDAVRTALGLREVVVFGNSWGGTLAAAYGATLPDGLLGLVLSSPLINTETWLADNAAYRQAFAPEVQAMMSACEAEGRTEDPAYLDAVDMFYRRHLCRADPWPDHLERSLDDMNLTCYAGMWGPNEFTCTGVLAGYDASDDLPRISVPTLFTCGAFDEATPVSTQAFSDRVPRAKFEVFSASSHMAFIEERTAYIETIRQFLQTFDP